MGGVWATATITLQVARALEAEGYPCGYDPAAYDQLYVNHVEETARAPDLP